MIGYLLFGSDWEMIPTIILLLGTFLLGLCFFIISLKIQKNSKYLRPLLFSLGLSLSFGAITGGLGTY